MCRAVTRLVNTVGYEARVYPSAESFLSEETQVEDHVFCMLVDIHLPGISGLELVQLRLDKAARAIPVIFMTALEDEAFQNAADQMGCLAYFRKPFESTLMVGAIREAADKAFALEGLQRKRSDPLGTGALAVTGGSTYPTLTVL